MKQSISSRTWLVIGIISIIIVIFYWQQVRPNLAKKSCYKEAITKAIKIVQDKDSRSYLYDREHWKTYRIYANNCGFFDKGCNPGPSQFTFEENIKTGIEPAYIQENLDKIKKETSFYDDDYNKYYKRCLQSKGL